MTENTSNYLVRFMASVEDAGLTKTELSDLAKRSFYRSIDYIPNQTFFDEEIPGLWFEMTLSCIPQIGWRIYCVDDKDFWNSDLLPKVIQVTFHIQRNMFEIDLDWSM